MGRRTLEGDKVKCSGVHELRVPKAGREKTISGYFDDPIKLALCAAELDATGKFAGVCITLNPCNPALLARRCNRVRPYAEVTTSDHDIRKRCWLMIDCDPKQPAGISSAGKERGRAITTACGVWDDLRGAGFGDPVVADSGNSLHLLYRVDLPNDRWTRVPSSGYVPIPPIQVRGDGSGDRHKAGTAIDQQRPISV
jgi:hypothetical protein